MRSSKNKKGFFYEMGGSNYVSMHINQTNIAIYCIKIRQKLENQLTKLWQSLQEPSHHNLMAYPILMLEPMRTRNPNILLTLSLVQYWNPYNNTLWSINPLPRLDNSRNFDLQSRLVVLQSNQCTFFLLRRPTIHPIEDLHR